MNENSQKEVRILFFDHAAVMGGAEFSLLDILTGIRESPIKASLLGPEQGQLHALAKINGIETLNFKFIHGILSIKRSDLERKPLSIISGIPEMLRVVSEIRSILIRGNYSIIYTNTLKAHLLGGLAGKLSGVKVIWHFRDIPVQKLSRFLILLGARLIPNKIVAVSRATASQFLSDRSGKITVIHNGLDIQNILRLSEREIPGEMPVGLKDGNNGRTIGIIGQISRWKGQDVFLKAASIVVKKIPQARFVIVGGPIFGEDDFAKNLNRYVNDSGLDGKVIFLGHQSNVYPLMKRLDLLANCSIEPEPFGRVIIEAMSLGVPVVATGGGAAGEIIDDGLDGLIVPPSDPEALAGAMERILTDSALKIEFIAKGRAKISESFGLEMMLKKISDVIFRESRQ